jgi:hypothetical protein
VAEGALALENAHAQLARTQDATRRAYAYFQQSTILRDLGFGEAGIATFALGNAILRKAKVPEEGSYVTMVEGIATEAGRKPDDVRAELEAEAEEVRKAAFASLSASCGAAVTTGTSEPLVHTDRPAPSRGKRRKQRRKKGRKK